MKIKKQHAYRRGKWAEYLSIMWLVVTGHRILAHRLRTALGEIDILACKNSILMAIEVKARPTFDQALESLTRRQCRRIERALAWYLMSKPHLYYDQIRFDIMMVSKWRLRHLKNAWSMDTTH